MPAARPALERFIEKVECVNGHWIWTGGEYKGKEYGQFWFEGKGQRAHRVSYKLFVGPLSDDEQVHHRCEIKGCVRPMCLMRTDHAGNMFFNRKEYCVNGHSIAEYGRYPDGACKRCKADKRLADYHRRGQ